MKERPINLTTCEVAAIQDRRKTQKRIPIKPQPWIENGCPHWGWHRTGKRIPGVPKRSVGGRDVSMTDLIAQFCPYGIPGDRLWVREKFFIWNNQAYYAGAMCPKTATWKPSIHMPRWASRLVLEITDVRVQRVQEISEDDADAEGFGGDIPPNTFPDIFFGDCGHLSIPECFGILWDSIYGPGAWNRNDWVWAITFKVVNHIVDATEMVEVS